MGQPLRGVFARYRAYYEIGVVADDFVVDDSYVVAVGYVGVDGYVVVDGGDDDFVALSAWALEAGVPGRS